MGAKLGENRGSDKEPRGRDWDWDEEPRACLEVGAGMRSWEENGMRNWGVGRKQIWDKYSQKGSSLARKGAEGSVPT